MFAWTCLALFAVAAAAPEPQAQVISADQLPLNYQNYQTVQTLGQPIQNYQTVNTPYQVRTVSQPQYIQTSVAQPQIVQTSVAQPQLIQTSVAQPQYQTVQYQTVPAGINTINYQPAQVRLAQVKTVKKVVKPAVVQQIQSTVSPLTIQQVTPQVTQQVVRIAPKVRVQQIAVPQVNQVQLVQRPAAVQQYSTYQGVDGVAPQGLAILRQVQDVQADGTYAYAYETENGIKFQEEGRAVNVGTDAESSVVQGSYSYVAPDGTPITVNYIADENGFRAEGEHIPKPNPEITRAVEYLRSLPPRPEDSEGQYVRDSNGY